MALARGATSETSIVKQLTETLGNNNLTAFRVLSSYFNAMSRAPHILLVEDDREICALVTRFLQTNDMRVSTAGDGRHMDQVLTDSRIDLIVLDVMLPGEDGLMICRRLRLASKLPVIMLISGDSATFSKTPGRAIRRVLQAVSVKASSAPCAMPTIGETSAVGPVPENPIQSDSRVRENQRIIRNDDCDRPFAWNVCRRSVQVAAPA
jgi:CheY-like chemotaxis protein